MSDPLQSVKRKETPPEIANMIANIEEDLQFGIRVSADYEGCGSDWRINSSVIKSIPKGTSLSEGLVCVNSDEVKGVSAREVAVFLVTHCFVRGKDLYGKEDLLYINYDINSSRGIGENAVHFNEENVKWIEENGSEYSKSKFDLNKGKQEAKERYKEAIKKLLKEAKQLGVIQLTHWENLQIKVAKDNGFLKSDEEWPDAFIESCSSEAHIKTIEDSKNNELLMKPYVQYCITKKEFERAEDQLQGLNSIWKRDFEEAVLGKETALHHVLPKNRDDTEKTGATKVR